MATPILFTLGMAFIVSLSGCLSPIALHKAVLEYDRTVNRVEAELLLLNIARARQYHPIHFTTVSSVAATFDFRTEAGILGRIGPSPEDAPVEVGFSTSVAENPTVTIIPISGEEFTKRILRPLDESQFEFLVHQGLDINMLLRLMARGVLVEEEGTSVTLLNNPTHTDDYRQFRQRLLHLAALNQSGHLFIQPLSYEEAYPVALDRALTPVEVVAVLEKGYRWVRPEKSSTPMLMRKILGRLVVTNYNPNTMSSDTRRVLNETINQDPRDWVYVDIQPGSPGGNYPFQGRIMLRSFNAILGFIARGIGEDPEFPVDADPRTDTIGPNPARTLEIAETTSPPNDSDFSVELEGRHYSLRRVPVTQGMVPSWNQEAFSVLTNLFQMTVTDVSNTKTPLITIPKGE
ncbi:hypothetical protein [Candidatus Nitrospira neomarina]|uniref:Uncharacterized protein n=1 Tax=Candidatus Nitrospira neomarina TaxID=3020899 RepID=A0AA96GMM6_9BACT|nr:hypothetical protein [Candidatus Nitrospira neomarina]WNM64132.1 hypothetical protein PQG83_10360 [Candidatus Nitrospira neomarina]